MYTEGYHNGLTITDVFSIAPTAGGGIIGRAAIGSPFHQTIYVLEREERIDAEELIRLLLLGTYKIYIVAVGGGAAAAIAPSWPGVKRWTWSMDPGEKSSDFFFFFSAA